MRAERDPDLLLIERMLAPPPLDDARSSLEFWQGRRKKLPLYRLLARREAREMAARWQKTVRAAEQARFEASPFGRLLAGLGVSSRGLRRVRSAQRVVFWLAWAITTRRIRFYARALALTLLLVVAAVTVLAVVAAQLV